MPADHVREGPFDDAAIERLRLAAEEVAWLTGRGYGFEAVGEFVARHHQLSADQRAAIAKGTCSEPQYRRRAARELEAEDVAKRTLSIDAVDAIATLEAALAMQPILQTLDGTVRAFGNDGARHVPGPHAEDAIDRLLRAAKELRPSLLRFVLVAGSPLEALIMARAENLKVKVEMVHANDALKALRKEKQIVTGDADTLDACGAWFNLVGRVAMAIPGAKIVRLQ